MNIFQQFIKSLYSPETIAKFRMAKIGRAILYVFLLMFIASIPMFISLAISINALFNAGDQYLDEIPEFEINNGVLESELEEPYINDEEDMTLVFDSTGEVSPGDLDGYGNVIALLDREVIFVTGGESNRITYQDAGLDVTKDEIDSFYTTLDDLSALIVIIVLAGFYLFNTALKFIGIFVLSVIGILLKRKTADHLRYRHLWVLSAFTVTMPTILFSYLEGFGLIIPFSFILYWIIAIVMMNLVLRNVPKPKQPQEPKQL
ncbi:DUF1189 domain-containing protein [Alkalicoccus halolimnae]|uniref:DUF1189 domain-containing protein n=1 Tax=Alkalicoccus halolimnae TaxID=1667239 RepID=A0A5C7FLY3_9BACI|nr:DUF1189 domain-containing protein [Alkalicoccus halolimnae]TXF86406.1 DUF1189 domain-containing protein [Alkalicoccus halolimnae]